MGIICTKRTATVIVSYTCFSLFFLSKVHPPFPTFGSAPAQSTVLYRVELHQFQDDTVYVIFSCFYPLFLVKTRIFLVPVSLYIVCICLY